MKALVHRCCGRDDVPTGLRAKVLARIQQVQAEINVSHAPTD